MASCFPRDEGPANASATLDSSLITCPSDEGSTKAPTALSAGVTNVEKLESSVTSKMSSDEDTFKSCREPSPYKGGFGSKLGSFFEKICSRLEPCARDTFSSDQRKMELLVVLFSAVFLFTALATRAGHNEPVPSPLAGLGTAPPPALSTLHPTSPPQDPLDPTDQDDAPNEPKKPENVSHSTYIPGDLTVEENGLLLSTGLKSRIIGKSGSSVVNIHGEESAELFHPLPDAGACFTNPNGDGGWAYVSNSEEDNGKGGVGAIYFDANGNILRYERLLDGTTDNCGGGKTRK